MYKLYIFIILFSHEISIWSIEQSDLILGGETFVGMQRSDVCCSFSAGFHRSWEGFWSTPLWQILSKSLSYRGCRLATRSFTSLHRFSIGFRSGDWLGHSRTLICFFLSHSFVALAVCFGSLSCWKTHPWPIFSAHTEGRRLSPKISRYMPHFILPSIRWSRPVHWETPTPPCFTVGMVFLGLYSAFLFLQTRRESSWCPNSSILVSSGHIP